MSRTKNFYTTREAAKVLGISVRTAQQWLERGVLRGWKTLGGHRRIDAKSVDQALQSHPQKIGSTREQPPLRILIIEDDQALLKLYRAVFSKWPFPVEVFTAPNGFEGLVTVGESTPNLLICDLRLPGVNGFQIVRALKAIPRYRDLIMVIVSGMPLEEIDAHGGMPEMIEVMGKPIDFERLRVIAEGVAKTFSQIPPSR